MLPCSTDILFSTIDIFTSHMKLRLHMFSLFPYILSLCAICKYHMKLRLHMYLCIILIICSYVLHIFMSLFALLRDMYSYISWKPDTIMASEHLA